MRSFFRQLEVQIHSRERPKKPVQLEEGLPLPPPSYVLALIQNPKNLFWAKTEKARPSMTTMRGLDITSNMYVAKK